MKKIVMAKLSKYYKAKVVQRWKKLTKKHTQNFESEKLAHKICTKNAQNRAKLAKMPKIAQEGKPFNKTREKNTKISTAVKN